MHMLGGEEPEVHAIANWTLSRPFVASAALHEGALVANYPWDGSEDKSTKYVRSPDDATFKHMAAAYATWHKTMSKPTNKASFVGGSILVFKMWEDACTGLKPANLVLPTNPPVQEFPNGGTTNGAAWYPIYGSMQDWNYIVAGCFELTLELSPQKWPPEGTLPTLWSENREALIKLPILTSLGG